MYPQVVLAVEVPRARGEELRRELMRKMLVDRKRKILQREGFIEIPVLREVDMDLRPYNAKMIHQSVTVPRKKRKHPIDEIIEIADLPSKLKPLLPRKWQLIGKVLILKLDPRLQKYNGKVAEAYAKVLRAKTVVKDVGGIGGPLREPKVQVILGQETETIHKENRILFRLDVSKIMFSSGNMEERIRMAKISSNKEVVVDMFAGIGYFSIPMAVHSLPKKIYACEVSTTAYHYLCENIRLNRANNVEPLLGDCREVAPEGIGDRVVMGYLRGEVFLSKAIGILRKEGFIHYHECCPNELLPSRPLTRVQKAAIEQGKEAKLKGYRIVKSYAPGVSHVVLDLYLK